MAQQTHPQHGDASLSEAQQSTYDSLAPINYDKNLSNDGSSIPSRKVETVTLKKLWHC